MTRFIFIHDFYRDGYNDVLAEVQRLQASRLWTKERRAHVTKHEVSTYLSVRHKFPRLDASYWAGRVAAIKSAATADYCALPKETGDTIACTALPDAATIDCSSCGDPAVWQSALGSLLLFHCDPCKQEQIRTLTAYMTPDGWDWDEHELVPLPVGAFDKRTTRERIQLTFDLFRFTALLVLGVLDMVLPLPIIQGCLQIVLFMHFVHEFREVFRSER